MATGPHAPAESSQRKRGMSGVLRRFSRVSAAFSLARALGLPESALGNFSYAPAAVSGGAPAGAAPQTEATAAVSGVLGAGESAGVWRDIVGTRLAEEKGAGEKGFLAAAGFGPIRGAPELNEPASLTSGPVGGRAFSGLGFENRNGLLISSGKSKARCSACGESKRSADLLRKVEGPLLCMRGIETVCWKFNSIPCMQSSGPSTFRRKSADRFDFPHAEQRAFDFPEEISRPFRFPACRAAGLRLSGGNQQTVSILLVQSSGPSTFRRKSADREDSEEAVRPARGVSVRERCATPMEFL
eukprot:gene1127-biopygen474